MSSLSDIFCRFDIEVPMRDGVLLKCNIARPAGEGRYPVIAVRTPYGKDGAKPDPLLDAVGLAREGFVVIHQDVRGRGKSGGEGDFVPFLHEGSDGDDLIAWAAAQPFSTGDVFLLGASYPGFAQFAAAVIAPEALRGIAPSQSPGTPWRTLLYRGGVFELGTMIPLFLSFGPDMLMRRYAADPTALGTALTRLMSDLGGEGINNRESLVRSNIGDGLFEMLAAENAGDSPILQALLTAQEYETVTVPALITGGWYDFFSQGAIDQFTGMRERAGSAVARKRTRLILGPWTHASQSPISGERHFGMMAAPSSFGRGGLRGETIRFFRELLADTEPSLPPVKLFVMGENVWRDEQEFPLARTRYTPWYLGKGILGTQSGIAPPDRFTYDPANPVPTWGGNNVGATELAGARDQRPIENRADVLLYTSAVLEEPLEVTGIAVVELWASSSAPDTDFVARLVDVAPDGTAYNIAEGILRARYRDNPESRIMGSPLEADKPYLFRIELTPTSNLFRAGHRVRLQITSSSYPRWEQNLNIWEQKEATLDQAQPAEQRVYHEEAYPSRVILPIIPRGNDEHGVGIRTQ